MDSWAFKGYRDGFLEMLKQADVKTTEEQKRIAQQNATRNAQAVPESGMGNVGKTQPQSSAPAPKAPVAPPKGGPVMGPRNRIPQSHPLTDPNSEEKWLAAYSRHKERHGGISPVRGDPRLRGRPEFPDLEQWTRGARSGGEYRPPTSTEGLSTWNKVMSGGPVLPQGPGPMAVRKLRELTGSTGNAGSNALNWLKKKVIR